MSIPRMLVFELIGTLFIMSCFSNYGVRGQNPVTVKQDSAAFDVRLTVKDLFAAGPAKTTANTEEKKLYELINAYRGKKGLSAIPYSKSLSFVAQLHVRDLAAHPFKEPCNSHSWSNAETWKGGCYTADHKKAEIMWNKPRELTSYKGNGYEIARGAGYATGYLGAADSLESWKSSSGHHDVIINQGIWKKITWKAIGVGIYRNYAVVWFGEVEDPEK